MFSVMSISLIFFCLLLGHLTVKAINRLQVEGEKNVKNNMTIWYGHYPTTSISTEAKIGLSSIVGYFGSVYLCGHLHDLGGLFPRLQAMHQSGETWCH